MIRTPAIDAALVRALSTPRLGRYLATSGEILDSALSLYERNGRLAEAFHRPLQAFEVCLRNHMNARLTAGFGENWYRNDRPPFEPSAVEKLDKAMDDVERGGARITQGAVVAELNLGFWVMILGRTYDESLWKTTFFSVFSEGGKRMARQRVHNRIDQLRKLRNRVAHHEPIFHWDLAQSHADLIQAIAWVCPDTAAWAWEHSRVPYVLANPWPP